MNLRYNPKYFVIASNQYQEFYTKISRTNEEIFDIANSMKDDSIAEHKRLLLRSYEDLTNIANGLKKNSDMFLRIAQIYQNAEGQIDRNNARLDKDHMNDHVNVDNEVIGDINEGWILELMKENNNE